MYKKYYLKLLLLIGTCISFAILFELVSRVVLNEYYIWPPGAHYVFKTAPEIMPGVEGEAHFRINSLGVRANELEQNSDPRIITIGGSTTECLYLDQDESWPYRLQEKIAESKDNTKVWVGNAGRGGNATREHILQLSKLFARIEKIDMVIFLIGFNDLGLALQGKYEIPENEIINKAFSVVPARGISLRPDKLGSYIFARRIFHVVKARRGRKVQDDYGEFLKFWRQRRRNSTMALDELPDVKDELENYKRNIDKLIAMSKKHDAKMLFVTQPVLWSEDINEADRSLLWGGISVDESSYYTIKALMKGMNLFNNALIDAAERNGVACLDAASLLPRTRAIFYDDCHFNENGAKQLAELIYDSLPN